MILRTPPPQRKRPLTAFDGDGAGDAAEDASGPIVESPLSSARRRLIVPYEVTEPSDGMACTYHCRQMVKSEFIVALDVAEKQVAEYKVRLEKLEKQLQKSENERITSQDRVKYLEQELAAAKGREEALQERVLKEYTDYHEQYRAQVLRITELEMEAKKEMELRMSAESSASSAQDTCKELEGKLQQLMDSAEREERALRKEKLYLLENSKLSASKLTAKLERTRLRAESAESELTLLEQELQSSRNQLEECVNQKIELERKLSSTAAASGTDIAEIQELVNLLQEELRICKNELEEARRFKDSKMNNELLKEKLMEEKRHRERAESELAGLQEVQAKAHKLELELLSWKALLREIPDVSCYDDIPRKFASLQKEALENMIKVGDVTARLKELEMALESADLSKQHALNESALAKERAENAAREVKRLEFMLAAVSDERDRLKKDIYLSSQLKSEHANEAVPRDLEKILREKDQIIKELESSIHEQKEIISHQHSELNVLNEKLSIESRKVKSLEREGDRLRSEIGLLEAKIGHGDYSATSTKVLRMVNTLAVDNEAKKTIEALQSELKKAQERLQAVEELKGNSDSGKILDPSVPEKLAQLKAQIATLEKREERYKAVFAEKISVFRKACCTLFGYKIVMDDQQRANGIPVTRFCLQSVYAQSDDEKLEFEYESGSTNITANEYTSMPEISQQIEIFVRKMNSIPAFTANLTMESFNKRTIS